MKRCIFLAEGAFDVRLRPRVVGLGEDGFGWALLYQLTQIQEDHMIGESPRLTMMGRAQAPDF
jgi:hypothetical protein